MNLSRQEFRERVPSVLKGRVIWEVDLPRDEVRLCRWWAYPFMRIYCAARNARIGLYHWLNHVGVMKTPEGNRMILSDIWRRRT
ncbi:hypothetical protein DUZ99_02055 [Xylanibacillus composti]|nr:hypothetical protein [Xylanibacillus composti]